MFTTDTQYPVLGAGQENHVDVLLRRVGAAAMTQEAPVTASPENAEWTLVRLGEQPVTSNDKQRAPSFTMNSADKRVSGSGGCNRFTGNYTLAGDQLKFGQLAGTMMACLEGMEQEQAFHKALTSTAAWRITDEQLELLDGGGKSLATLARGEQSTASDIGRHVLATGPISGWRRPDSDAG